MVRRETTDRLTRVLGIRHPILMAGMAGGLTSPDLVAAVSGAGALGVFGANGMPTEVLAAQVADAVARANGPVGVNVLLARAAPEPLSPGPMHEILGALRSELGIAETPPARPAPGAPLDLLRAGLEAGASVVSVALGDPSEVIALARAHGAPVLSMVTNVRDALAAEAAGVDVIVAQGAEAGGHRSEIPEPGAPVALVGTMALVPQVARAVRLPVVAAGGIMDGAGMVAALALGAAGVQLGTRFLGAAESSASPAWKAALDRAGDSDTVVTATVTGRPARMIRNRLHDILSAPDAPPSLGWLRQGAAMADIVAAAGRAGRGELQVLLAGQAAGLNRVGQPAAQIVAQILAEAAETIERLGGVTPPR